MSVSARRTLLLAAGLSTALLTTGALSFYEENLPSTLNPLFATGMPDYRSQELIFDRLYFHYTIDNRLMSRVIEKGELADGGKAYRLTLKPGMKWHDSKPVTAKDICFTVNAMLDPKTPSPIAQKYRTILAGCEEESAQVALVRFTKVFHNPQERLGFSLLPESAFQGNTSITPETEFSLRPTGTGPFKGTRGKRGATFEAFTNPHHAASIGQMSLQEGQDPLIQVTTLKNNGVQGIIAVPPPLRGDVSAADDLQLKSYDLRSWWFVAVNTKKGPLADKRVRQALNMVIDRTELRQYAIGVKPGEQNSPCEFISGPFVQSSPYYNRAVATKERSDKAAAAQLLTEAGLTQVGGFWTFKGTPVTLNIGMMAPLDNEAPDLLQQLANQIGAAGFGRQENKITVDEWNRTVLSGKATNYDLLIGKWSFGVVEEVNDLFETRSGARGGNNIFNYSNPSVDAAVAAYNAARTDTAAQDAYHQLHGLVADDLPYLFLWKLDTKSAWRTNVTNNIIAPFFYWTEVDSWKYGG